MTGRRVCPLCAPGPTQTCDLGSWLGFAAFGHRRPERDLVLREGRTQHAQRSRSHISKAKLSTFFPQAKNSSVAPCGPQDQVQILECIFKSFVICPVSISILIFCCSLLPSLLQTLCISFRSSWAGLIPSSDTPRAPQVSPFMYPSHVPDMLYFCLYRPI